MRARVLRCWQCRVQTTVQTTTSGLFCLGNWVATHTSYNTSPAPNTCSPSPAKGKGKKDSPTKTAKPKVSKVSSMKKDKKTPKKVKQ